MTRIQCKRASHFAKRTNTKPGNTETCATKTSPIVNSAYLYIDRFGQFFFPWEQHELCVFYSLNVLLVENAIMERFHFIFIVNLYYFLDIEILNLFFH